MFVQLNKCVVVCGSVLQRFCINMSVVGNICLFCVGPGYDGLLGGGGECCFGVMYCAWYGVLTLLCCRLVVEVCADYSGLNMFHVCLNFGVVYGVFLSMFVV